VKFATGIIAATLLATALTVTSASPAVAQGSGCGAVRATADRPPYPLLRTFPQHAADGRFQSFFFSSWNDWQYLQLDLGCVGTFNGVRRLMSLGNRAVGDRGPQGEAVSVSADGVTWTQLTSANTTGWESYTNYRPHAWHSIEYGLSSWLRPDVPLPVRYVRFHWDGNDDFLHEVEVDVTYPTPPPPLTVQLRCDAGHVSCVAVAAGGSGSGFTFSWTPGAGTSITSRADGPTVSSIGGTCWRTSYAMGVSVTDSAGSTVSASVQRPCTGLPLFP
jgi:hypothetical protein